MRFRGYSSFRDEILQKFEKAECDDSQPLVQVLSRKLALCDYELLLISPNITDLDRYLIQVSNISSQTIIDLHKAWKYIRGEGLTDLVGQKNAYAVIDRIGGVITSNSEIVISPLLRRFKDDPTGKFFFLLLTGNEAAGLPLYDLFCLCNLWQLEHGCIPIHAAGVIHRQKLFLFGGVSGAGKSTISALSEKRGDRVLDEDILSLRELPDKQYSANAWGYSTESNNLPIFSIFKIAQDKHNNIIPLSPLQITQFLMDQIYQVTGNNIFSDYMLKLVFSRVADIARHVPGYELHFRNSPDFWDLIDEQLLA